MLKLPGRILIGALALLLPAAAAQAIEVNTLDDHDDTVCDATDCTLREAVKQAAGQTSSTITFAAGLSGSILLKSDMVTWTANTVEIDGPADGITIDGDESWTPWTQTGGTVSLRALTLTKGLGFDGGGGPATGGGVELEGGTFNAYGVTISESIGGNGEDDAAGPGAGGGMNLIDGTAFLVNCNFSGNTGGSGGFPSLGDPLGGNGGAGNLQAHSGAVTLINCTLADGVGGNGTSADDFGGDGGAGNLGAGGATVNLGNTLIGYGIGGPGGAGGTDNGQDPGDVLGSFSSLGHNLILNSTAGTGFIASDILDADASPTNLDYLMANGGSVQSYAIQVGSIAIDTGDNDLLTTYAPAETTDSRGTGFPRIVNTVVDIGAFEFSSTRPVSPDVTLGGYVGENFSEKLPSRDIDGDVLIYDLTGTLPAGLTFDPNTGLIEGVPTTTFSGTFQYTADDGLGPTAPGTLTLEIRDPSQPLVTTLDDHDDGSCSLSDCTLREALGMASGQASSTITFASGLSGTILLQSDMDPWTNNTVEIDGPSEDIIINGDDIWIPFTQTGGQVTLRGLTLAHGNGLGGASATGGGYELNGGNLIADGVTFYYNTGGSGYYGTSASGAGGGLNVASNTSTALLTNCTFSLNLGGNGGTATTGDPLGGNGGAGAIQSVGDVTLVNCTLADNEGGDGGDGDDFGGDAGTGGIAKLGGSFSLGNTLIGYNAGGTGGSGGTTDGDSSNDLQGAFTTLGHNLIGESLGGTGFGGTDILDPAEATIHLDDLNRNGGPVRTYALLVGSVAIDAGGNGLVTTHGLTTDARGTGFDRIVNTTVDIGAFEWTSTSPVSPDVAFTGYLDQPFSKKLPSRDIDGDALTYAITGTLPNGLTLNTSTGIISGTPTVTFNGTFPYTAADGNGPTAPGTLTLEILALPSTNVTTLDDHDDGACTIADCTLREAINSAKNISLPEITFDEALGGGFLTLTSPLPSWDNGDDLQITGPSGGVIVSGDNLYVPFTVENDSSLELIGFTIYQGRGISGFAPTGGAVRVIDADLALINMTLANNTGGDGPASINPDTPSAAPGAVYFQNSNSVIFNCTFYENYGGAGGTGSGADGKGGRGGAGAVFSDNSQVYFLNNTMTANVGGAGGSAGDGGAGDGGAGAFGSDLSLVISGNNLIAGNTGGTGGSSTGTPGTGLTPGDVAGSLGSVGFNIVGVSAAGTDYDPNDILDPDPATLHLHSLALNGGQVPTCALEPGSIAIDAGNDNLLFLFGINFDARGEGFPREVASNVDIGAYEADFVRPSVAIDTPVSNSRMLITDFVPNVPSGTAVDDGAVNFVQLNLSRSRGGVTSYWNGTAWSSTKARVPATLCGCTGPGVTSYWIWDTNFPAEADLDEGKYRLDATAVDSGGDGISATRLFTLVNEIDPPQITIASPVANAKLTPTAFLAGTAHGAASDNVVVASVTAKFYRVIGGVKQYWNGTAWNTPSANTPISVTGAGTNSVTWNLTSLPAVGDLDAGAYYIQAVATDSSGNTGTVTRPFTIVSAAADLVPPSVVITGLAPGTKITPADFGSHLPHGTATDNDILFSMTAKLTRTISGVKEYWDGAAWSSTTATTTVNCDGLGTASTNWNANLPGEPDLLPGSYSLLVIAKDVSGNSGSATLPFVIVLDSEKPVVTVSAPLSGATVQATNFTANTVRGTATDNATVTSIIVKLYRTRGGVKEFWDGGGFGTTSVAAPINVTGLGTASATWNLDPVPADTDLDTGTYSVTVNAIDSSGNSSLVITRTFNVTLAVGGLKLVGSDKKF